MGAVSKLFYARWRGGSMATDCIPDREDLLRSVGADPRLGTLDWTGEVKATANFFVYGRLVLA